MKPLLILVALLLAAPPLTAQSAAGAGSASLSPGRVAASPIAVEIDRGAASIEQQLIAWRRHLHQNPELSNRETETARFIAETLRGFGLEPRTGIARTGVVAVLEGAKPGPAVALRADMDGLPVTEEVDLPFASKARSEYEGKSVGVMHACGHDAHMAILLATAKVLTDLRSQLRGTVTFIFQPAEEGAPRDEQPAGAERMVQEGVLKNPDVEAIFGLHVFANEPSGAIGWRSGAFMAASDTLEITVKGRQTHGAAPWAGVDPIVIASQIVLALQTIVSRQIDITAQPAIVTVGQFEGGARSNIVPDRVRLAGTIRTFDDEMQEDIHERITRTAQKIAEAGGGTAEVRIDRGNPVTANDPELTARMLPTLRRVAGEHLTELQKVTVAEDFTYFQRAVPGLFFFLGITPPAQVGRAAANHSPQFFVDETALVTGVRALAHLTADYLFGNTAER